MLKYDSLDELLCFFLVAGKGRLDLFGLYFLELPFKYFHFLLEQEKGWAYFILFDFDFEYWIYFVFHDDARFRL